MVSAISILDYCVNAGADLFEISENTIENDDIDMLTFLVDNKKDEMDDVIFNIMSMCDAARFDSSKCLKYICEHYDWEKHETNISTMSDHEKFFEISVKEAYFGAVQARSLECVQYLTQIGFPMDKNKCLASAKMDSKQLFSALKQCVNGGYEYDDLLTQLNIARNIVNLIELPAKAAKKIQRWWTKIYYKPERFGPFLLENIAQINKEYQTKKRKYSQTA